MREAVHIFLKDSRHLRYAIAAVLVWTALLGAAGMVKAPEYDVRRWQDIAAVLVPQLSQYLLPIGWWFLVAKAFHAEALPGTRQFWLTRPYRRVSLFLAKVLFVLAYITLPLGLAMAASAATHHLPAAATLWGILWAQVLILIVVVLPAAVLATLTSTLTQFVVAAILLPILFVVNQTLNTWGPFGWFRSGVAVAFIFIISTAVLIVQFSWRRTGVSRLIGLTGILAAVVVLPLLSWRTAFALQSRLRPWGGTLSAAFVPPEPELTSRITRRGSIRLFYRVTGVPSDAIFTCEGGDFSVEGARGAVWRIDVQRRGTFSTLPGGCQFWELPPDLFVDTVQQGDVKIRGAVYVTVFGPAVTTALPKDERAVVPSVGVCSNRQLPIPRGVATDSFFFEVNCSTGPRRPGVLIEAGTATYQRQMGLLSYSPFPAELTVAPTNRIAVSVNGNDLLVVTTRQPIAHVRVPVESGRVRFLDFY